MRRKRLARCTRDVPRLLFAIAMVASVLSPGTSDADATDPPDVRRQIEQLQRQLAETQTQAQSRFEALKRETDYRLEQLQVQIARLVAALPADAASGAQPAGSDPGSGSEASDPIDKLEVSGDFRLRYEDNSSSPDSPHWDRGVLRGRLGARYRLDERLTLGGRLVTGDRANPRTADTTIGGFVNDLDVGLDQAYAEFSSGNLFLTGGKFAKPFASTELLWDGDVNPQGLGGRYELFGGQRWSARVSGVYFIVDEQILEDESDMLGGQLSVSLQPAAGWRLSLHGAYYDYDLGSVGPGGARGNTVTADGRGYASDFDLWDTMATAHYDGWGDRWDLTVVADYVKNLGARGPDDSAYGVDLTLGNLARPGRFQLRYGYARAEADAVLGLFAHDNITLPTNYELHTLAADYALSRHSFIGLTNYFHRKLDPALEAGSNDWVSRTRLNLYFTF